MNVNHSQIMNFCNGEFGQMRALMVDDEPWFVGADAAALLGYRNRRDALQRHVAAEDKKMGKNIDETGSLK